MELTAKRGAALLTALAMMLLAAPPALAQARDPGEARSRIARAKRFVDEEAAGRVFEHARVIDSFGSRQTGQPGCMLTAKYIRDTFSALGLQNVTLTTEPVTAPISGDAWVELPGGRRLTAWPLVPNGVQSSSTGEDGLSGRLVYAGGGALEEVEGRNLDGAILLLDYNSGDSWLKLMSFGAAAAVFIEPEFTTWRQTDTKYVDLLPLYFPRVWVWGPEGRALLEAARDEPEVTLYSKMSLDNVDAPYVEAFLPGTGGTDVTINLVSHFDARSIVPALAPGGDEAWGVAALLELARYFKAHPGSANVRFIAFSGNWQSQALSRLYVARTLDRIGPVDRITCAIDLSTDSAEIAADYNGLVGSVYGPQLAELKSFLFGIEGTEDSGVTGDIETWLGGARLYGGLIPLPHESEFVLADMAHKRPLINAPRFYTPNESWEQARAVAVVFQTERVWRFLHNTPLATFEKSAAHFDRIPPQLTALFYTLDRLADYAPSPKGIPAVKPTIWSASQSTAKGYAEVKGNVRVFSLKTAWYDQALPRDDEGNLLGDTYVYAYPFDQKYYDEKSFAFLPWPLWPQRHFHMGMQSFMNRYIVKVGPDGDYYIPAIAASHSTARFNFLAFTLDRDGRIIYATDYGLRGDVEFSIADMSFFTSRMQVPITIFPCGTLVLYGLETLEKFNYGDNVPDQWAVKVDYSDNEQAQIPYVAIERVMRAGARTEADEYSFAQWKDTAMVFLKPDMPAEILFKAKRGVKKYVLNNSSEPTDEPPGYSVERGATTHVRFTPLQILRQLNHLNNYRLDAYDRYGVRSYEAEKEHRLGTEYLRIADDAIASARYGRAASAASLGLAAEGRAYEATLRLLWDVVSTTVFYFTLLIPFSFLTERLLFPQSTPSRTLIMSSFIFTVFVGLLWVFHPGFKLADNIWITIISFLIVILTLPALLLIVSRGLKMLKESGEKYYKSHASDVERLGVLVAALSLAISNMRRRRLRTGLTLTTITLLILALVLLTTSTSFNYTFNEPREHLKTDMEGILVSNTYNRWHGIFRNVHDLLERLYGGEATVVAREYHNYAFADTMASKRKLFLESAGYSVALPAIQILDEREPLVSGIDRALVAGRWFSADDVFAVIVSKKFAASLRVSAGDTVAFESLPLQVIGVIDGPFLDRNVLDPDGRQVTPLYFADPSQGDMQNPGHFPADDVIYLPRRFVRQTGLLHTAVWATVIKPRDRERIIPIADSIALKIANIDVFRSLDGSVTVLSAYHKVSIKGSAFMIMPLAVAFFMVLAVMLGTVHERRREINIFSSVGLSPRHVAGMFFVESIVYAGIASVLGYFIGIIMLFIFRKAGLFPPVFYPNYLGIFVIYSVGLAMLATVSSSAYPMYIASKIANPSLERTWRISTSPENGRWHIEFPFIASDIEEVSGIMEFLREFVDHFSGEGMGVFASLAPARLNRRGDDAVSLDMAAWLAPFERNVTQAVSLVGRKDQERNRWNFTFEIQYLSGPTYLWLKSNKLFIDAFRKQMLIWRAFSDKMIDDYIAKGLDKVNGVERAGAMPEPSAAVPGGGK